MLLPVFLLSIMASMTASMNTMTIDQLVDTQPIDKYIPALEEFDLEFFKSVPPDASLTTSELVVKYGFDVEVYEVTTADGYILAMHRIPHRTNSSDSRVQRPVILLMHGLLCSSAGWVLSGVEKSLAYILVDAGYEVWLGDARGNVYSRKHVSLSILDKEYWDFSWHEIGVYDLPAMIDHILKVTGRENLFYMGHSQGTTSFFVMASERPEYNEKVKAMFAMAPVAYCGRMFSPILQFISRFSGPINELLKLLGQYQFEPSGDALKMFAQMVCAESAITNPLCANVLFLLGGFNKDQYNKTLLPVILGHVPAGAATKQIMHYSQLINTGLVVTPGKFRRYDYGLFGNMKKYDSIVPPNYDLSKIKVPVSLHYGTNDWLANVLDVDKLYKELGNPFGKFRVPHEKFNHLDFLWAKDVKELLYNKMLSILTHFRD